MTPDVSNKAIISSIKNGVMGGITREMHICIV